MATKKKEKYIVRTYSAGVFYGEIKSRKGMEVVMANAIRLWHWEGAASLSQMAEEGVKIPGECKFAVPAREVMLTQAIEILSTTAAARKSIEGVVPWRA